MVFEDEALSTDLTKILESSDAADKVLAEAIIKLWKNQDALYAQLQKLSDQLRESNDAG